MPGPLGLRRRHRAPADRGGTAGKRGSPAPARGGPAVRGGRHHHRRRPPAGLPPDLLQPRLPGPHRLLRGRGPGAQLPLPPGRRHRPRRRKPGPRGPGGGPRLPGRPAELPQGPARPSGTRWRSRRSWTPRACGPISSASCTTSPSAGRRRPSPGERAAAAPGPGERQAGHVRAGHGDGRVRGDLRGVPDPVRTGAGPAVHAPGVLRLVHPSDRAALQAEAARATGSGEADFESEYRIVRPDGAVRWIGVHGLRSTARGASPPGWSGDSGRHRPEGAGGGAGAGAVGGGGAGGPGPADGRAQPPGLPPPPGGRGRPSPSSESARGRRWPWPCWT